MEVFEGGRLLSKVNLCISIESDVISDNLVGSQGKEAPWAGSKRSPVGGQRPAAEKNDVISHIYHASIDL